MKKITLVLNEFEEKMLHDIVYKAGYRQSEALRLAIRELYRKAFPNYSLSKKDKQSPTDDMSPEEYCKTILNGDIVEDGGVKYCRIMEGAMETLKPLSIIK